MRWRRFCEEFLNLIDENEDIVYKLWMSDEVHIYLYVYVNRQNFRLIMTQILNKYINNLHESHCVTRYVFIRDEQWNEKFSTTQPAQYEVNE